MVPTRFPEAVWSIWSPDFAARNSARDSSDGKGHFCHNSGMPRDDCNRIPPTPVPVGKFLTGIAGAALFVTSGIGAVLADAQRVSISKRDCQRLVQAETGPDVAYRPGVDARGRAVAPADVGGGFQMKIPDVITFDVNIDLRRYMGGPKADSEAASSAALAADKARIAASEADTAATAAQAAADAAQTAADDASAAADAAEAASDAALAAYRAGTGTRDDYLTALAASQAAEAASVQARSDYQTITALANQASTAAAAAGSATSTATVASQADTAAAAAAAAATAAQASADADVQAAGDAAETAATAADVAAGQASAANTATDAAFKQAAKIPGFTTNLGTVRYDIRSGLMTFNGQPMSDPDQALLAQKCREAFGQRR